MADLSTYLTSPLQALKQLHPDRLATLQNANLMTAMYILHNRPKEAVQVITQAKEQIKDSENDKEFLEMEGMAKMAMGGGAHKDAFYVYQEIQETFGHTPSTVNGQAACQMIDGKYAEAEKLLLSNLEKMQSADVFANLYVCALHLGKNGDKALEHVQRLNPEHPLLHDLGLKQSLFDRAATAYKPSR